MALLAVLLETPATQQWAIAVISLLVLISTRCLYRIRFHPLAHIPGPVFARCSSLWLHYHTYMGDETTAVHRLHKTYGPVVRVAPNDVDISDGEAIAPIYVDKGGFTKADCYVNFDIGGHASIFSTLSSTYRAPRAKAVVALFSMASIRSGSDLIYECVDKFVSRMQAEASTGQPVNVLNLSRALAADVLSSYLFHRSYRSIEEKSSQISITPFVDTFVAVGRFFYLPNGVFLFVEWFVATFMPDNKQVNESFAAVDDFVSQLLDDSAQDTDTYPGRLLNQGISKSETIAQCKDIIFAGTDSTGMNLATVFWHLSWHPEKYAILRKEILENQAAQADIQTLPYLRGVVREGLRLARPNPSRLLRVVPERGWNFRGFHFPPGTNVGVAAFELHQDPNSFPEPARFLPERWLNPTPEMQRDLVPFGSGTRSCIARNLATAELFMAVEKLVEADVLREARPVKERIEIYEWFNSRVRDGKIELVWPAEVE